MPKSRLLVVSFAAVLLATSAAHASEFAIQPLKDGDDFKGCLAQNTETGVGFLAFGDKVVLFANSPKFKFAKGDQVSGSWSVDGGPATSFSSTADSAATATVDVPNTTEAVTALTSGRSMSMTANSVTVDFNLEGGEKAFMGLTDCMSSQGDTTAN